MNRITGKRTLLSSDRRIFGKRIISHDTALRPREQRIKADDPGMGSAHTQEVSEKLRQGYTDSRITGKRILLSGDRKIQGKRILGHETSLSGTQRIEPDNPEMGFMHTQKVSDGATAVLKKQQLNDIHDMLRNAKKVKDAAQSEDEMALYEEVINIEKNHLTKTAKKKVREIISNQKEKHKYFKQYKKEYYKKALFQNQAKKQTKKELKKAVRKRAMAKAKDKMAEKAAAKAVEKAAASAAGGAGLAIVLVIIAIIFASSILIVIFVSVLYAPIPSGDSASTEGEPIPEESAEDFLRGYIPELRNDYIAGLQAREAELRAEGYNHIVIYNLMGMSLGGDDDESGSPSVLPGNITDPDCGILSEEDYVQLLRMVFVPCLMAKYDTSYNNTQAKEVAQECFNLITYREEYPQNVDSSGVVNYVYCDGTLRQDNQYSCYAFYRDSSGRAHAWEGCLGRCWNCSIWQQHDNPDASVHACCVSRQKCPGHAVVEGEEAKFWHSNVGSCDSPVSCSFCNGYRICYGHKEINIVIGTGSADDLLQEYFLDRIEELESLENLTEEQLAELSTLKNYYEIARAAIDNDLYGSKNE